MVSFPASNDAAMSIVGHGETDVEGNVQDEIPACQLRSDPLQPEL